MNQKRGRPRLSTPERIIRKKIAQAKKMKKYLATEKGKQAKLRAYINFRNKTKKQIKVS